MCKHAVLTHLAALQPEVTPAFLPTVAQGAIGTAVPEGGTEGQEPGCRESGAGVGMGVPGAGAWTSGSEDRMSWGPRLHDPGGEDWSLELLVPMGLDLEVGSSGVSPLPPHQCKHSIWEPQKHLVQKAQHPRMPTLLVSAKCRMLEILETGRVK